MVTSLRWHGFADVGLSEFTLTGRHDGATEHMHHVSVDFAHNSVQFYVGGWRFATLVSEYLGKCVI